DFLADAVHTSKAVGRPVKVIYTREDDMHAGWYRPVAYNALSAALDADGWPTAWVHRIASPSILEHMGPLRGGIDGTSVEGAQNLPYAIPNLLVTYAKPDFPIPVWFWRSVGSSINGYVTECFLDELALAGGKDPVELRRRLLSDQPRHRRALDLAAQKAGWGTPLPAGRARGVAVHESFGSIVAEVAEVSLGEGGEPRVHRVVCAVDCGQYVNPDTVVAQMESGIVYGLSAALYGEITIDKGRAVQDNFDSYQVLRIDQMPLVETHIVAEGDPMGGVGEPGTPPIAPAVCNALLVLTGKPVRRLPIVKMT
ncbi:MAG TPA: molybdopterin cofactor-binding domain-containing protein, partial [Gemmatimonadales bacterium]|nr:molybdopterin cofactor-binding domain-containing protein [Gemmatimonadales bacterium]